MGRICGIRAFAPALAIAIASGCNSYEWTVSENVGPGAACTPTGATSPVGPPNYAIRDIGKPGVPRLSAAQLALVKRIANHHHSRTLRFAILDRFVVFDAVRGPCPETGTRYAVLSNPCNNEFYEPGEEPRMPLPAPGGCQKDVPPSTHVGRSSGHPTLPPMDATQLVRMDRQFGGICSRGSRASRQTQKICEERDEIETRLRKQGWCDGHGNSNEAKREWQKCRKTTGE